jgi:peptidoglycan/xylan/chitin deacetylase (PgdA/CDA1 family)
MHRYPNQGGIEYLALTFDIDWAPTFVIKFLLDVLKKERLKATIFCTHYDTVLEDSVEGIELAIHPNFQRTEKKHLSEKISSLMKLFPEAKGERSHRLFSSSTLTNVLGENGILYESNFLLYKAPALRVMRAWNDVLRIPIYWEDDMNILYHDTWFLDKEALETPGLKVFNFHPLLLYLNAKDYRSYEELSKPYNRITDIPAEECGRYINKDDGDQTFFNELRDYLKSNNIKTSTLAELARLNRG